MGGDGGNVGAWRNGTVTHTPFLSVAPPWPSTVDCLVCDRARLRTSLMTESREPSLDHLLAFGAQ